MRLTPRRGHRVVQACAYVVLTAMLGCGGGGGGGGSGAEPRPEPRISHAAESVSVFTTFEMRGAERVQVGTFASFLIEGDSARVVAFPGPGETSPRPCARVRVSDSEFAFLGDDEGVCDPPPALARDVEDGHIVASIAYTYTRNANGAAEQRATPPLLAKHSKVTVLGQTRDALLLYVLVPERAAPPALDLSASALGITSAYPPIAKGQQHPGPDGTPRAIAGIQVYTGDLALVGLLTVDPASGELLAESVLSAQVPRPGLHGPAHAGSVTVWTIDARSGLPLEGVSVVLSQGALVARGRTDSDGKLTVAQLQPGAAYSVTAGGRALTTAGVALARAATVVLALREDSAPGTELVFGVCEVPQGGAQSTTVPIYVSSSEEVSGIQLSLSFDPAKVTVESDGVCPIAAQCALELHPLPIWGDAWQDRVMFAVSQVYQADGWLFAGIVFDDYSESETVNIIPAGTRRFRLLDLRTRVQDADESIVLFANGVSRPGQVIKYNNVLAVPAEDNFTASVRPHTKPALLVRAGDCPECEKLPEDGGQLFREAVFSVAAAGAGDAQVQVTGSPAATGAGSFTIDTKRAGMLSDALAVRYAQDSALAEIGARYLLPPGECELECAALPEDAKITMQTAGGFPVAISTITLARCELRLFGPSGCLAGDALAPGRAIPSFASQSTVEAQAQFPALWDLPQALVTELTYADGSASATHAWVDVRADAEQTSQQTFLSAADLLAPASSTDLNDTVPHTVALRWRKVEGAGAYYLDIGNEENYSICSIFVPDDGAATPDMEVALPPMPATAPLTSLVPYTWRVRAVALTAGTTAPTGTEADLITLGLSRARESLSAARIVRLQ